MTDTTPDVDHVEAKKAAIAEPGPLKGGESVARGPTEATRATGTWFHSAGCIIELRNMGKELRPQSVQEAPENSPTKPKSAFFSDGRGSANTTGPSTGLRTSEPQSVAMPFRSQNDDPEAGSHTHSRYEQARDWARSHFHNNVTFYIIAIVTGICGCSPWCNAPVGGQQAPIATATGRRRRLVRRILIITAVVMIIVSVLIFPVLCVRLHKCKFHGK